MRRASAHAQNYKLKESSWRSPEVQLSGPEAILRLPSLVVSFNSLYNKKISLLFLKRSFSFVSCLVEFKISSVALSLLSLPSALSLGFNYTHKTRWLNCLVLIHQMAAAINNMCADRVSFHSKIITTRRSRTTRRRCSVSHQKQRFSIKSLRISHDNHASKISASQNGGASTAVSFSFISLPIVSSFMIQASATCNASVSSYKCIGWVLFG